MSHHVKLEAGEQSDITDAEEVVDDCEWSSEPLAPRKPKRRRVVVPSSSPFSKSARDRRPVTRARKHLKPPPRKAVQLNNAVLSASIFTVSYVFEVLRFTLVVLRKPLSLVLVGYLLAVLVSHLRHVVTNAIYSTTRPVCLLPGFSSMAFCQRSEGLQSKTARDTVATAQRADYPKLVDIQSATFEQLLDDSVSGAGLALEIKKAEMATSDLTTLVRTSRLTSREKMAETLSAFVEDARRTGRGLQRFSAKVGSAVDGIIAVNDYALRRIEEAASANSSPSVWRSLLIPFYDHSGTTLALIKSFTQTMAVLESELHTLILAAEASLHDLDTLEEKLKLLHTIVAREDDSLNTSKQELLSQLWTIVGGNRAKIRRYDSHLRLLSELAEYRQRALAHVVGALQTLQTMSADLEALRERVSRPALSGEIIPLEVHVRSIRGGLERLTAERLKAKKIEDARYAKLVAPLGE